MTQQWWQLIGSSFVSFMLSFMLMTAWLPFAPKRAGTVLLEVPMGFLQRVLVHRTKAALLMAYVLIATMPGLGGAWLIPGTPAIALLGLMVILMLPMRYVFTDRGVAINNGVPRPYKLFRRFEARPGRRWLANNVTLILRGRKDEKGRTLNGHSLYLPTDAQAEVTRLLKKHVR